MKKSIFLFFAAILCAMTANAQWYLRGSFNDWGTSHQFVNNVCEIELPAGTSYEFKVAVANWSTGYGYPEITSTSTKTQNGSGNTKFKTGLPGIYKFEISSDAKKLTVTYPEVPAPHDITVRAKVPAHWTNDIYAHVWTSENASGSDVGPLTKEGDYYVVTKNAGALYVIFKNGSAWSDKNQTVDLCYTEDVCLQLNQSGSAKATATVIDCGAVSKDITVKAVVPGAWEDKITAWVWPTGGEGKEVTPTKEGNWYVITENCIELNVIFKNGEGWKGNENQTANITGVSENTCYQISALNKDGEGKCTYTVVDCEAAIEPEAKPVDVYTIVGAETLVGTAWDLNNTDNDMTKQGDGSYVLVKENVELATTGTYEYKVVKNRSWDWKGVNGGNNLTLTGVDVDGTYNVTFTLNKELNALTASLELVEAKKVIPECYVAGDESLTGQDWNAKSVSMTYDEATEVYTATLTAVPAGTHNMKVVYGGEWLGFDHLATSAPANVKEGEDKKIQFTLAEAGDVTVTYHATNGIDLTGNFVEPVTYDYYIAGTLAGGWSATQQGMTKDGDVYKHTFSELNADEYEFKITDGQWNTPEDKTHEHTTLAADYEEVTMTEDGNIKITTEEAINLTVIFDATAGTITFEGLTEKVVVTPDVISYVLMGVGSDWTTGIALTKNETAEYEEYVLLGQEIAEGDAVKVVTLTNGGATAWCGNVDEYSVAHTFDDNGNIVLAPGKYDFYFKVNDDIIYIGGEAYPVEPEYEVIEAEITNLEIDMESMCIIGGPSSPYAVDVFLILTEQNPDGTWALSAEESSVAIQGVDATFIDGYAYDIDVDAPAVKVVLHVEFGGTKYELQIDMTSKPVVIEIADAIVSKEEYSDGMGGTYTNWTMDGQWSDGETTYPVLVNMPDFDPTIVEADMMVTITIGSWVEVMYGAAEGLVHATVAENVVTLTGTLTSYTAGTWEVTISGTLPADEPEVPTALDNIDATVAPVKAIVNGQLIIIRNGVQYNAQGAVVK